MIAGLKQSDLGGILHIWDVNGSVGGPIVQDKLWFHHAMRSAARTRGRRVLHAEPYRVDLRRSPRPAYDNFRTGSPASG